VLSTDFAFVAEVGQHLIIQASCRPLPSSFTPMQVWHTAPVHAPSGWAYLGELGKYVPVAPARTESVQTTVRGAECGAESI
jgi:hypothetical protein